MSENISAIDLLVDDHSGQGLKTLQEKIWEMQNSLKTTIDKGLAPDEFKVAKSLLNAVETAKETADKLYKKLQGER